MKGVRRDKYGLRAYVKVGGIQRERRFPFDTSAEKLKAWRDETRAALRKKKAVVQARRDTLRADATTYLDQQKHLASYKSRVCEIEAWLALYGDRRRSEIGKAQILDARTAWLEVGYAPKTVNHRVRALRHLFRELDGHSVATPCDEVKPLPTKTEPRFVSPVTIRKVADKLTDPVTRARFKILTASGVRPSQLMRAIPADVDMKRQLWVVRAGKGGKATPMILSDDLRAAWQDFIGLDAWGAFDTSDYAKALYAAGWPQSWRQGKGRRLNLLRPYQARHSVAIALLENGADWQDVADQLGHTDVRMLKKHYAGVVLSRLKATRARIAGRLGWQTGKTFGKKRRASGS